MDWNDLAYKTLWTAVSAVLGFLAVELTDAPYSWAPVAVAAINAVTVLVRQRVPAVDHTG